MRLSLLSMGPSTSDLDGPTPARQLDTRQSRSGTGPTFCSEGGGTPYVSDARVLLVIASAGADESSDLVLVSRQTAMLFDMPAAFSVSWIAAVDCENHSLPLSRRSYAVLGTSDGQSVNDGVPLARARLESWTTVTELAFCASFCFEKA